MTIPDATEDDYERDAEADYKPLIAESHVREAWIRRAVAAEKRAAELESQFDEAWRHAQALTKALAQRV